MPFSRISVKVHLTGSEMFHEGYSSLLVFKDRKEKGREKTQKKLKCNHRIVLNSNLRETACPSFFPCLRTLAGLLGGLRLAAGMTAEAAICVPLMVFAMYIIIFPLKVMEAERRIQNTMEQAAKDMILVEYAKERGEDLINSGDYEDIIDKALKGFTEAAALVTVTSEASGTGYFSYFLPDAGTAWLSDDEDADSSMIYLKFNYGIKLPFTVFGLSGINKSLVTNRRAWTGSEGGRGRSTYGSVSDSSEEGGESTATQTVYIGKSGSSVYHLSLSCHYLSNVLKTADASSMSSLRNSSGASYHACSSCNPGSTGTVYYFESGTAYHSSESCKAITAYATAIDISEVGSRHVCSYCAAHYS